MSVYKTVERKNAEKCFQEFYHEVKMEYSCCPTYCAYISTVAARKHFLLDSRFLYVTGSQKKIFLNIFS